MFEGEFDEWSFASRVDPKWVSESAQRARQSQYSFEGCIEQVQPALTADHWVGQEGDAFRSTLRSWVGAASTLSSACSIAAGAFTTTHEVWSEQSRKLQQIRDQAWETWQSGCRKQSDRSTLQTELRDLIGQAADPVVAVRVKKLQREIDSLNRQIGALETTWKEQIKSALRAQGTIRNAGKQQAVKISDLDDMFDAVTKKLAPSADFGGRIWAYHSVDPDWLVQVANTFQNSIAAPAVPAGGWGFTVGEGILAFTDAATAFANRFTSSRTAVTNRANSMGSMVLGIAEMVRGHEETASRQFETLNQKIDSPMTDQADPGALDAFVNFTSPIAKTTILTDMGKTYVKTTGVLADYNTSLTLTQNLRAAGTGKTAKFVAEGVDLADGGFAASMSKVPGPAAKFVSKYGILGPLGLGFSTVSGVNNYQKGNYGKASADGVAVILGMGALACTGPVGLGFAVGAAAWGVGQILYEHNDGFKNAVDGTVDFVSDGAKDVTSTVKGWFT